MITKEEFLTLYPKYMDGSCTPAEKALIEAYSDDLQLQGGNWTYDNVTQADVRNRIWQQLSDSRKINKPVLDNGYYKWLQVAAVLVFAVLAGLLFVLKEKSGKQAATTTFAKNKKHEILPGSNKAYLTLTNGKSIILDDAKNGEINASEGVKVTKTANGMLVYSFSKTNNTIAPGDVAQFNTITTPRGGQYKVTLEDGTLVWLNAASSIKFPQAFTGNSRVVEITGEAYFEVAKNKAKPFIVKANGTQVEVLGTHFNISAYNDDAKITTTLLEGSVRMSKGTSTVMLAPGQQGIVAQNGSGITVSQADTEANLAWINGFFVFRDASIVDIMKLVSRWYDVDVEFQDDVQQNEFGGTISRYKNITELLDNMRLTRTIHYKIDGRRVIIMK
ncbi:FecR family protein [Mucilaginibacter sp.]|uniref:FecR family protein n=1 Tax=Mucilaginibacter sp. TaxID=1882438 RepID=UPI002619BDF0|nr:FecR family protein [Mucilaginibacter sp.]MDB5128863.1 FecR family protein [Mucilaginibacter sp.]